MPRNQQFSISLPPDIAEMIEKKIESGAYASVDDVIVDGVRGLLDQDDAVEQWLRTEVSEGHAEYLADTSKAVPAEAVLERIKARRAADNAS